jgi:CelD/BcsL family acetyltransferase involved in cellulose biosynthesis
MKANGGSDFLQQVPMSTVIVAESMPLESAGSVDAGCCVEVVSNFEGLLALQATWDEVLAQSAAPHPFLDHSWIRTWWECFGAGHTLYVLVVRAGTTVIGIAPLMLSETRLYGIAVRRLSFLENDHSPRCGFILARASAGQACRAIWDHLQREKSWDMLELNHLPADGDTLARLSTNARDSGYLCGTRELERSPYVPLSGDWETYLKGLGRSHRRNMRKRLNRLQREGRLELEVVSGSDGLSSAIEDGMRIEAAAWKEENGTAMCSDPAVRRFYNAYAESAGVAGTLRLLFLKFNGARIAFSYALCERDRLYVLKAGYDPAFARYSPYQVLCYLVLQESFARGVTEYDFLGHCERWKLEWKADVRPHVGLFVFRPAWHTTLLHALKCRVMPMLQRQPWYLYLRDTVLSGRRARRSNDAESTRDENESA